MHPLASFQHEIPSYLLLSLHEAFDMSGVVGRKRARESKKREGAGDRETEAENC